MEANVELDDEQIKILLTSIIRRSQLQLGTANYIQWYESSYIDSSVDRKKKKNWITDGIGSKGQRKFFQLYFDAFKGYVFTIFSENSSNKENWRLGKQTVLSLRTGNIPIGRVLNKNFRILQKLSKVVKKNIKMQERIAQEETNKAKEIAKQKRKIEQEAVVKTVLGDEIKL